MSKLPGQKPKTPGISIGAARLRQAREFIVLHPDMSKSQLVAATGLSDATIARARRDLVSEGTIPAARNTPVRDPKPETEPTQSAPPEGGSSTPPSAKSPSPTKGGMLDHEALMELAAMIDAAVDSGDEEMIQKKLIKQCLTFAFRLDLHPDTRMSASQMYHKLKDMAKARALGPGKPITYAAGVARLADMHRTCGPQMVMDAIKLAFEVKENANAEQSSLQQPVEKAASATSSSSVEPSVASSSPPQAPGAPVNNGKDSANPW
jgi:hypothetical protein